MSNKKLATSFLCNENNVKSMWTHYRYYKENHYLGYIYDKCPNFSIRQARQHIEDLEVLGAEIDEDIIEDLKSTLEFGTGLGIAAPQIGVNKKIIVVGAKKENIKYNDAEEIPITAMINPTWKKLTEDTDVQYEGCMSVPSIRGKVERYKNIELSYYNENGEKIIKQLNGFFARLVQHECDHLDGIVFLEKVKGPNGFATKENIEKYNLREVNWFL